MEENKEQFEPVFVPAKPGEKAPEGIWVPNRKDRRAMKKNAKKAAQASQFLGMTGKQMMENEDFKQDLYKDLLKYVKNNKEKYKNGDSTETDIPVQIGE